MNIKIEQFLEENFVFTMAASESDKPYCAACFYAYDKERNALIFSSDPSTIHIKHALSNSEVAGTILPSGGVDPAAVKGIQFTGEFIDPSGVLKERSASLYLGRFPFAKEHLSSLWIINLGSVKLTDNTVAFGHKELWKRQA